MMNTELDNRGVDRTMKRLALLVLAISVLVAAGASVAYASTSSGYQAWGSVTAYQGTDMTPHKGYATTTIKCAVCHAVHKGTSGGQLLLRDSVANACLYCHVNDTALGNIRIYAGDSTKYSTANNASHDAVGGAGCTTCHAVHGGNTWEHNTLAWRIDEKILRKDAGLGSVQTTDPANSSYGANPNSYSTRDKVITAFCTQCHQYYQPVHNGVVTLGINGSGTYQSHIMTGTTNNFDGTGNTLASGTTVAWKDSTTCQSCHDAGNGASESDQSFTEGAHTQGTQTTFAQNFPHYTANKARFLRSYNYYAGTEVSPGIGEQSGASIGSTMTAVDGPCLKCHMNSTSTGVGWTY
jgi:predicted CXXCH cytochrome family protein